MIVNFLRPSNPISRLAMFSPRFLRRRRGQNLPIQGFLRRKLLAFAWDAGKHPASLAQVCGAILEPDNYVS